LPPDSCTLSSEQQRKPPKGKDGEITTDVVTALHRSGVCVVHLRQTKKMMPTEIFFEHRRARTIISHHSLRAFLVRTLLHYTLISYCESSFSLATLSPITTTNKRPCSYKYYPSCCSCHLYTSVLLLYDYFIVTPFQIKNTSTCGEAVR
jgi:hypothetical protein